MKEVVRAAVATTIVGLLCLPYSALGWGANADRLATTKAVDILPDDIRSYFESNRQYLVQHVLDPVDAVQNNPGIGHTRFIRFEKYGHFPYTDLPRDYRVASYKYSKRTLDQNGLLPWSVGLYSQKLTDAFRTRNWDDAREAAAQLAFYVAEAHDPFNTTIDSDGHLAGQTGVDVRFGSSLVDRYSQFFYLHPNQPAYVQDPTDHAFEMCLSAHSWIENVLLADKRARANLSDYTDEYFDRFYSQAGAMLVRQISDASSDIASYWLTAWINAGKPQLPSH
ncbi:MAG TPA: hypothetical protein VEJ39_00920 [Candidatus Acidoferrales bacterium]|nr:hypothetical protein [Candidatus Acidoferrales bacterium]